MLDKTLYLLFNLQFLFLSFDLQNILAQLLNNRVVKY